MDLQLIHVRYDQTQFYPFSGNPPAARLDALPLQAYQHAHRRKEPGPELPDCFQPET